MYKTFHRWFSSHFFVGFMEKKPFVKSCGVFDHFSQVYQVLKFLMIKMYLDVKDIMHPNEPRKHASCG